MGETSTTAASVAHTTKIVLNLGLYKARTGGEDTTLKSRLQVARISRATQHRWMNGGCVPDMELARAVAKRLGVPMEELFVEVAA